MPSFSVGAIAHGSDHRHTDQDDLEDWHDAKNGGTFPTPLGDDVEEVLRRQDAAMELLVRLRREEPFRLARPATDGGASGKGRRDFRRWPMPPNIMVERHDGTSWNRLSCLDIGVGGVRVATDAEDEADDGPFPIRLRLQRLETTPQSDDSVIVLGDVMWRSGKAGADWQAGVRFEFLDNEERDFWNGVLIDALLTTQALQ